tara:strand:- start:1380 stop:2291 length:912 start_codon:yes stop_codon:yes gene_type:complete
MTCEFSYKGISLEDCVNLCNEETDNLCTTYCSNKCANCNDASKCPWLVTTTLAPTNSPTTLGPRLYDSSKMNAIVDRLLDYSRVSDMMLDDSSRMNESLNQLRNVRDDSRKRDIVYKYLMEMYDVNTNLLAENYEDNKVSLNNYRKKRNIIANNKETLKELDEKLIVKDREFKINLGKYNKLVFETRTLKFLMFVILTLFVIPLLYLGDVLPKIFSVLIYLVLIGCAIAYAMYTIKMEQKRRDTIFYQKYNFNKPTRENILKSQLKQALDPKCSQDLNTEDDDFNPNDIDIGSVSSWKNQVPE